MCYHSSCSENDRGGALTSPSLGRLLISHITCGIVDASALISTFISNAPCETLPEQESEKDLCHQ